jgi:uncharacterized protein DUF3592
MASHARNLSWKIATQILFGTKTQVFGWTLLFVAASALFVAEPYVKVGQVVLLAGPGMAQAQGEVRSVEDSGWGRGYSSTIGVAPSVPIKRYEYAFETQGEKHTGICYTELELQETQPVTVEFLGRQPDVSRIVGTQAGPLDPRSTILFGILGTIGLCMLVLSTPRHFRRLKLYSKGEEAQATVTAKEESNVSVGGEPICRLVLEYETVDGKNVQARIRSRVPVQEGERVPILYLPGRPSKVEIAAAFPGQEENQEPPLGAAMALSYLLLVIASCSFFAGWIARLI